MPPLVNRLVIVGVGLIGGSIALAARRRSVAAEVVGVCRNEVGAERAVAAGVVEHATADLPSAVSGADLVVVCTPVGSVAAGVLAAAKVCPRHCVLTDAGSTKAGIVDAVHTGLADRSSPPVFVASHPLAGDHRSGPESARDDLLEGRTVVVTPTEHTPGSAIDRVTVFWERLGATVVTMAPEEHDNALAQTSHLPHVLAAALAAATPEACLPLAATGWRDTTRVASAPAALWRDILMANRAGVLASLTSVDEELAAYRAALAAGDADALEQLLETGRQRRDAVGD